MLRTEGGKRGDSLVEMHRASEILLGEYFFEAQTVLHCLLHLSPEIFSVDSLSGTWVGSTRIECGKFEDKNVREKKFCIGVSRY